MDDRQLGHGDHGSHHSAHGAHHHPIAATLAPSSDAIVDQHAGHDHSEMAMNGGGGHMMMMMYFHGGYDEVILFDAWRINSVGGLIGSMFAIFVMGIVYEGLKFWREHLMRTNFRRISYDRVPRAETGSTGPSGDSAVTEIGENGNGIRPAAEGPRRASGDPQPIIKMIETNMCSVGHLVLTFMHFVQLTLAYFLMLIVMTFNTWLCLAVVFGSTTGHFLFGWRKSVVLDVGGDHCH